MLALRHLALLSLLTSCSIYSESLLDGAPDDSADGGTRATAGSGSGGSGSKPSVTGGTSAGTDTEGGTAGKPMGGSSNNVAGGGTGSDAQGGSAGDTMGGVPPSAGTAGVAPVLPTKIDLLDDMEDANFYLSPTPPRFGFWYVSSDKTAGSSVPKIEELVGKVEPARDGSTRAVHFAASGFKGWGSSVGFSFTDAANQRKPYDAGDAEGLAFWVRGTLANDVKLRVLFLSTPTEPTGKLCGGVGQGTCLDHFGTAVTVSSEWTKVGIAFSTLRQAGWGALIEGGFDPKSMTGIEFTSDANDADVWIDDVMLLRPE